MIEIMQTHFVIRPYHFVFEGLFTISTGSTEKSPHKELFSCIHHQN